MKHYLLLIIALLLLVLPSCDKKQKGTFTIKGQLLQDCGGNPVVGRKISVRERIQFGHGTVEIGSATTDDNGHFELVAGYYGSEPKEVQGLPGEYETPRMPKSGQTIDLGITYFDFTATIMIKINVLSNSYVNDTLFIKDGYGNNKTDTIFPVILGVLFHSYSYFHDNSYGGTRRINNSLSSINYSIGIAGLNEYKENAAYHINYCGQSKDTVKITLP